MMDGSSRKRSRTTLSGGAGGGGNSLLGGGQQTTGNASLLSTSRGPTMGSSLGLVQFPRPESSDDRVRASQLRDPKQRIKVLNAILKLSSSPDVNYALTGDSVLQSLLQIAMECMHWDKDPPPCQSQRKRKSNTSSSKNDSPNDPSVDSWDEEPVFSLSSAWIHPPTVEMETWALHWKDALTTSQRPTHSNPKDPNNNFKTLEVIVAILRNFSYTSANSRMLAYTPAAVAVLIGCMYEGHDDFGSAAAGTDHRGVMRESGLGGNIYGNMNPHNAAGLNTGNTSSTSASDEASKVAMSRINLTVNAMQTLLHLVPYLDVSGHRILADRLFYSPHLVKEGPMVPDSSTFGQTASGNWGFGGMWLAKRLDTKEDVLGDVTKEFLLTFVSDYLVAVWSLFPALAHVLTNPLCPRAVMLVAVDLLQELINQARVGVVGSVDLEDKKGDHQMPTLRAILVSMPNSVLERLVDLLYVPRLGPDSLEYLDPVHNIVTRVTTLKLLMGYDATVDTDLRDRTLDVLVPLLELDSPRMASRLGMHEPAEDGAIMSTVPTDDTRGGSNSVPIVRARLWDSLVPILTSTAGRSDANMLASQLFRELAKADSNQPGLLYVQSRLIEFASRDNRVAHLVWNYLYPHPTADEEEEDEDVTAVVNRSGIASPGALDHEGLAYKQEGHGGEPDL